MRIDINLPTLFYLIVVGEKLLHYIYKLKCIRDASLLSGMKGFCSAIS